MGRKLKWLMGSALGLGLGGALLAAIGAAAAGGAYWYWVVLNPGPELDRDHIRSIIVQESPVYYRDGQTRVGVFFEDEHRVYVPYDELPLSYIMSIVAAEDARYWGHHGVDPLGISRAMVNNVLAGGLVAGGSTLTQQTAKNLYYRPDRSLRSKGYELLYALRLEAHFTKEEILGFYVNQFHVSGNGRGLGIAARYFFSKDVEQLTVVEAAFLAGLVKGPSNYDPFIGDAARRQRSTERAHTRTQYVLRRLVEVDPEALVGPLPRRGAARASWAERVIAGREVQRQAKEALDKGFTLPFKKGNFRYDASAVLDEVARRLAEPPFAEVLKQAGIEDPATAGLKVVTTLDADLQREAEYALAHQITDVGVQLEGTPAENWILRDSRGASYDPDRPVRAHELRVGTVLRHVDAPKKHLVVDLGGPECVVDRDALVRAANAIRRGQKKDRGAKASTAQIDALRDALPVNAALRVSVRTAGSKGSICDLETLPLLQGAAVVLKQGELHAMVGGSDNRNFNRATALRQFGSTWKPLVYHAALRLGWRPDDLLDNRRGVFPFSTTFYAPRADHEPADVVSMSWAGVNSENLASVWLLYHLTDPLSGEEVRSLASSLELARGAAEDERAYQKRIQKLGILPQPRRLPEADFLKARAAVRPTLSAPEDRLERLYLDSLLYGWGFAAEAARQGDAKIDAALARSWVTVESRIPVCEEQWRALDAGVRDGVLPHPSLTALLSVRVEGEAIAMACGAIPEGFERPGTELLEALGRRPAPPPGPAPRRSLLDRILAAKDEIVADVTAKGLPELGTMRLDGQIRLSTLSAVAGQMSMSARLRSASEDQVDLYAPENLYWHQDFRVLLGLRYVQELAALYGVRSEIQTVMSLPLGASEITLEESASLYQGITTGQSWTFPGTSLSGAKLETPPSTALLISEIRDVDDRVLYKATPTPATHAPPQVAQMSTDILRNVVLWGTGTRARDAVMQAGVPVPLGGKTGTTNDFKNAAFVGFVPSAEHGEHRTEDGYTIAVYVGYDDNRPMSVGNSRIAGASGALPAWMNIAAGMQTAGRLGTPSGAPEGGWALVVEPELRRVAAEAKTGLPILGAPVPEEGTPSILVDPAREVEGLTFSRTDRPARVAPTTQDLIRDIKHRALWGKKP